MFRVAPNGLSDRAEDVCAAAARGIRLVMERFLPRLPGDVRPGASTREYQESATCRKDTCTAGINSVEPSSDYRGRWDIFVEEQAREQEEVFDLVWKALDLLHPDSACVEVRLVGENSSLRSCNLQICTFAFRIVRRKRGPCRICSSCFCAAPASRSCPGQPE